MAFTVDLEYFFPNRASLSTGFSLPIDGAGITVLFGPSGSGKSTLLHFLAGIKNPDRGLIRFGDRLWFDAGKKVSLPPQKRSAGLLFQDYPLFPHLTVSRNIAYGLNRLPTSERKDRVKRWIDRLKLRGKEGQYPNALSGGEQQRVALAQTLAPQPRLILLDEPFSALDRSTRSDIRVEVKRTIHDAGILAIVVTHDLADAMALGDHIIILSEGKILQQGNPLEIFSRPALPSVAEIVGVENLLPARVIETTGGMAVLAVGKGRLMGVGSVAPKQPCFVSFRAEEVLLERGRPAQSSARNHLSGFVREVVQTGSQARVIVDCGFPLTAHVTQQAIEDLSLRPGAEVTAVIKASAIQILPSE
ncbi:MAG: ABC transporter ATP-binding protein [Nitrospiria bacterium]